MNQKNYFRS